MLFLWIPVIPVPFQCHSSGITGFQTESMGHCKVLDEGDDDEEHSGPEPSNAEVANNDEMDTASHDGQITAEMV